MRSLDLAIWPRLLVRTSVEIGQQKLDSKGMSAHAATQNRPGLIHWRGITLKYRRGSRILIRGCAQKYDHHSMEVLAQKEINVVIIAIIPRVSLMHGQYSENRATLPQTLQTVHYAMTGP